MGTLKEFVVIAIFVLVAAVFLKMLLNSVKSVGASIRSPVESVTAEIIKKRSETGAGEFNPDGLRLGKDVMSVEFRLESGETITLQVAKGEFDSLREGARGCLNYRGKTYLGFTPDSLA